MRSSNKVCMKASIKHANITPPSLLRLFLTVELTKQSLDAAFVAERWPTRGSMEPKNYSQLHCRADQPVTWCSIVAINGSDLIMRVSSAWVVTIPPFVHMTVSGIWADSSETRERKKKDKNSTYFFVLPRQQRFSRCIGSGDSLEGYFEWKSPTYSSAEPKSSAKTYSLSVTV